MQRWSREFFLISPNSKSANSWAHSAIANFWGVPVRKFVMINPQIANPQMSLVSQSSHRKSANCHFCGSSANLKKYLGFRICGTYLRTVHFWYSVYQITSYSLFRNRNIENEPKRIPNFVGEQTANGRWPHKIWFSHKSITPIYQHLQI